MAENFIDIYMNETHPIYITGEITSEVAVKCQMQIAAIIKKFDDNCIPEEERVITIHITDCPGGSVSAGLAIYDAMICENAKMKVICSGMVASMAVVLTLGGDKGMRFAYPNTEFLMHQPLGGAQGQTSDILIQARHIEKIRDKLYSIISQRTNQNIEKVASDSDRDFIQSTEEALQYGIIDKIIEPRSMNK